MTVFRSRPWRPAVLSAAIVATCARGAGINTDVALTPPLGGVILRVQFRYSRLFDDPTPQGRVVHRIVQPITLAYGATERLALIGTVPVVYRRVEFGSGGSTSETGIGDIPVRAKFRFYQKDELGRRRAGRRSRGWRSRPSTARSPATASIRSSVRSGRTRSSSGGSTGT